MATEPRARLGAKLAEITPGDIDVLLLHQRRRRGERERDQDRALRTPDGTRSWRGTARTTAARPARSPRPAIRGAGASRRMPGIVHVLDPYHGIQRGWDSAEASLRYLEEVVQLEGPHTIAALHPRAGHRHQRHPRPAGRLSAGRSSAVRQARHPADRRRSDVRLRPHGRVVCRQPLERRARPHHHGQGIDERLRPAGRGRHAAEDRRHFQDTRLPGGLTYNSHPLACAAALATIAVYEEDGLSSVRRRPGC